MSADEKSAAIDMIRWTFSVEPGRRDDIATYLSDQGLDVFVQGEGVFHVTWDEPDRDVDEVVEELWEINGEPFDITQEEFHRLNHFLIQEDSDEPTREVA